MKKSSNIKYLQLLESALSKNTRIAYEKGWECFCKFCRKEKRNPLSVSADDVVEFLISISTYPNQITASKLSMSTISLYVSAINSKFNQCGQTSPAQHPKVKSVLRGLHREKGKVPRRVKALREYQIKNILSQCDQLKLKPQKAMISVRDAAIISIGFAGALRRSEICNIKVDDIEIVHPGSFHCHNKNLGVKERIKHDGCQKMYLTIRHSKTDQDRKGHTIPVIDGKNLKPIQRLQEWLSMAEISEGYVFQTMRRGGVLRGKPLHPSDIPRIVKQYVRSIGLNPKEFSGHSLRSGFVTSAAVHNARLDKIMEITRHTDPTTVMKYIRDVDLFQDHAGEGFL